MKAQKGRGVRVFGDRTQRGITYHFPQETAGVTQTRDSNNNGKREGLNVSWDHMLLGRPQHLPTSLPDRLYADVHRVRTHMVWVWLHVGPGGKKGPGSRDPPILTSCFCWKRDLRTRRPHQHKAQCSPSSKGDSMFMRRAPHHTKSACQHTETQAGVSLMSWEDTAETIPFSHAVNSLVTQQQVRWHFCRKHFSNTRADNYTGLV